MQDFGSSFLDKGKALKEEAPPAIVPILGPSDSKYTFDEIFNIVKIYLKSEALSKWSLAMVRLSDKEFIIYQGTYTNVWARFKEGRGVTWNHERLNKKMHKDLPPEIFGEYL